MSTTDDRFDDAVRTRHVAALERVSPATRAQLAQRRHAVLRGDARRAPPGMRLALAGFAAAGALAIGLQLRHPEAPAAPPALAVAVVQDVGRPDTLLDEDPEFYAWLASSDARLVAME